MAKSIIFLNILIIHVIRLPVTFCLDFPALTLAITKPNARMKRIILSLKLECFRRI